MNALYTSNWPHYLKFITESINNTPNPGIGGLKPISINSPKDNVKIDDRIGTTSKEPHFDVQMKNQKAYEEDPSNIQVGDFVYRTFQSQAFDKGYHFQVRLRDNILKNVP